MDDTILQRCNKTELLCIARRQKLGSLSRGLTKELLVQIVSGEVPMRPEYLAATTYTRKRFQQYIAVNIERARSQLPGCDGCCTTYPCSDVRHGLCFIPKIDEVAAL